MTHSIYAPTPAPGRQWMASPTTGVPPPLRRLQWSPVAAVDLATEFPWLILHQSTALEWNSHHTQAAHEQIDQDGQAHALKAKPTVVTTPSVYAHPLRAPRSPPPPKASPAQRAARKMLALQDEWERHEHHARHLEAVAFPTKPSTEPRPLTSPKRGSTMKKLKKVTKQTPTAAAASPQAKLQQWLARQHSLPAECEAEKATAYSVEMETRIQYKMRATLGTGLWTDEVASSIAAELSSASVFGGVMATRRLAFVPSVATSLKDETPSPLPVSTLEPTDLLSEVSPTLTVSQSLLPSPRPEVSLVQQFAAEALVAARSQAAEGEVAAALATLQQAIDRVRVEFQDNHDELRVRGFDFSALAHAMAQRLQRAYKLRHRQRLTSLVVLQRVWRRTRHRRARTATRAWRTTHACVLQRAMRDHLQRQHRTRSAVQIQRWFRIVQSQRLFVLLHRACRLLTTDSRRARELRIAKRRQRRRLWMRLQVVTTMLRALTCRRHAAACVQSHWRGCQARQKYTIALARVTDLEACRRLREDSFVEPRLVLARQALRQFYSETARGQTLVAWRVRAPWLRWRRLQADAMAAKTTRRPEAVAALRAMYAQRNGMGDVELRGFEARSVGVALGRRQMRSSFRFRDMDTSEVATSETHHAVHKVEPEKPRSPRWSHRLTALWTQRWMQWRTQWTKKKLHRLAARSIHSALWTLVVYPKLVLETSFLFRRRHRRFTEAAIVALLDEHERVLRVALRRVFRAMEKGAPKYECAWCGLGIATARMLYAHRNVAGTGCVALEQNAQQEHVAIAADVIYHQWWKRFSIRRRQNRSAPVVPVVAPTKFAEDAKFVRRVAARRRWLRNRASLRFLVDAARSCGPIEDESVTRIPAELFAQLVWLLDDASGHTLERIHAVTHCDTRPNAEAWIRADEAAYALGLATRPQPNPPLRTPVWTRAWLQLQTKWRSRRDHIVARYQTNSESNSQRSHNHWGRWRQQMMARVVASA